jgi:hypothetical protein|nr:MAG TPA: hypothetical protein [Caudoviricetes sp.]
MSLKVSNRTNVLVTGLDGNGTIEMVLLRDMCEGNKFNMSLPSGTASVELYVDRMTEQCKDVIFHCIDNSISITVNYENYKGDLVTHQLKSRKEAIAILNEIKTDMDGVIHIVS